MYNRNSSEENLLRFSSLIVPIKFHFVWKEKTKGLITVSNVNVNVFMLSSVYHVYKHAAESAGPLPFTTLVVGA